MIARGSGVFFGHSVYHLEGREPKKTPDPVSVAGEKTRGRAAENPP